ncbi:hypothetical protein CAC42_1900 [Sphaceloma murrayae]|uniref:ATP-dependent RNA helicase n=1 Tax=Sphaceloma murrayae TaxID=2082308 RepID=A0A2K1QVS4_9PEZI|nr:hypothetical protein CAC42_1900 [Sphaceloma murrayae]
MAGKLDPRLLKALDVMSFDFMSPVQDRVLAELPNYQSDCLVQAKTGTGKTVAFLLPTLHTLLASPSRQPRGQVAILIISPTRELALQIAKECDQLTSQVSPKLECHTAYGGSNRASHLNRFMGGNPSILVATPGRLKDYLSEAPIAKKFSNIRTLILDEADTMLESGFLADVRAVLKTLPPKSTGWQGMCFSATVPDRVKDVIDCVLNPGYTSISTVQKNETPTHERVPQYHVIIPSVAYTFTALLSLLKHEEQYGSKIIVFGVTANMVALFAKVFAQGLVQRDIYELHSRLSQSTRTKTTDNFKKADSGIMFASDVIGRGMDFPNVDLVVQVGLPSNPDIYVHRVGRTARAGNEGRAVILLTQPESYFVNVNRKLPIKPHPQTALIVGDADQYRPSVQQAMYRVDDTVKQRAYSSYIGFFAGSGLLKQVRLDKAGLVVLANDMAKQGMCCPEPPPMEKRVVGKMGLKGVAGFNYATESGGQRMGGGGGRFREAESRGGGGGGGGGLGGGEGDRVAKVMKTGRGRGGAQGAPGRGGEHTSGGGRGGNMNGGGRGGGRGFGRGRGRGGRGQA